MLEEGDIFNYAVRHYDNPSCKTLKEFSCDYNIPINIKKLLNKRSSGEDVNLRLLLNYFQTFFNVFSPDVATTLLFVRCEPEHYSAIKTVLVFLNYMPDDISGCDININEIEFDQELIDFLRGI